MRNEKLENRLIDFAVSVSLICESTKKTELGKNMTQQLIRSSTAPALNYGEARGAESKKDFLHKLRISLKELRESYVALKIIEKAGICTAGKDFYSVKDECNQLIAIFVTSIRTLESKPDVRS